MPQHDRSDYFGSPKLIQFLILAVTYFVVSKLGLLLSIPPGYATAIWPASGIALGCLLIFGSHLWPGVLLGSLLVNLTVSYDIGGVGPFLVSLIVPLSIGAGAAMQALLGATLIRKYVGFPNLLDDDRDVIRVLLLGAPLACLLNATWGSTTLFLSGAVSIETFSPTWWIWWVGDSIGVLIFLPLTLICFASPRKVWFSRLRTVGIPLIIAFAGTATIFLLTGSNSWKILTGALLITGLFGAFLMVISGHTIKIELLVKQRTAELQLSEQRLRMFAEAASDWFWEMGPDLRFTHFSKRSEDVVGVPISFHIGKTREEIAGEAATTDKWKSHLKDLEDHKPFSDFRYHREGPDGQLHYLSATGKPVFDDNGDFQGYIGVGTDLTKQRKYEMQLQYAKEEAENANRAKTEFLANMSLELRTPLNSIIGFAEVLKLQMYGSLGHENYSEYAADIHGSGIHLLRLISEILDVSKIEANQFDISEEEIDLAKLIQSSMRIVRERATSAEIVLSHEISGERALVLGDEVRLKQIILNLLTNAIKFTPPRGKVKAKVFFDDGAAVLQISDTGVGISKKDMPKVLAPFQQVGVDHNLATEGTGLGVYLSKRLTELHGGTFSIQSDVGEGTTVTVKFPPERTVIIK